MKQDKARIERLAAEAQRRRKTREALDFEKLLFGPQRAFVTDTSHFVAACCSRRAGKTYGIGLKLLWTAHKFPGCTVFYVTNTRRQAKRNLWDGVLLPLLRALGIKAKLNINELTCTLTNGSIIQLGGASDSGEIETYRGTKTPLAVIDEAQSFRSYLHTLIEDIFDPQTMDYGDDGQIYMTGTPNASCFGFFHDVMNNEGKASKGWSQHHWTVLENVHQPDPAGWLRKKRERQGIKETDPRYMREYRGLWVRDTSGLVYQIENENLIPELPEADDWAFVLGLDLGFVDATAFCVQAYSVDLGVACVLDSWQRTGMLTGDVAQEVDDLRSRIDFEAIVADVGGLGKPYAEEMIQRWGIPVEAAEKQHKATAIENLNSDLRRKKALIVEPRNTDLVYDARLLQWNYDKLDQSKGKLIPRLKLEVDDRTPDHLTDAWLYGYRKCRQYLYEPGERTRTARELEDQFEDDLWAAVAESDRRPSEWDLSREDLVDDGPLF